MFLVLVSRRVAILKDHPEICAGIHLTLNAEWKNYRWDGCRKRKVPSLVDESGYFSVTGSFFANNPKLMK